MSYLPGRGNTMITKNVICSIKPKDISCRQASLTLWKEINSSKSKTIASLMKPQILIQLEKKDATSKL